jgi:hypothetical protein
MFNIRRWWSMLVGNCITHTKRWGTGFMLLIKVPSEGVHLLFSREFQHAPLADHLDSYSG